MKREKGGMWREGRMGRKRERWEERERLQSR